MTLFSVSCGMSLMGCVKATLKIGSQASGYRNRRQLFCAALMVPHGISAEQSQQAHRAKRGGVNCLPFDAFAAVGKESTAVSRQASINHRQ